MENELIEQLYEEFEKKNKEKSIDEEQVEYEFQCLLESMASDDAKIMAMGESIGKICTEEKFTAFELCSMCGTLMVSACHQRAKNMGVTATKVFWKHMSETLDETVNEMLKELEDDSKDGDCNCKCE